MKSYASVTKATPQEKSALDVYKLNQMDMMYLFEKFISIISTVHVHWTIELFRNEKYVPCMD